MNRKILLVIIGAIILCFAGLNNKYPLLTLDSGVYINSGFTREVPADRSIMYGIFTAHASWGKSLWLVVFTQGLLLSLMLFYYFRYFSRNSRYIVYYLATVFFITFCMSASVTASTIDPGIFGGIALLAIGLLLFARNLKTRDFAIIFLSATIGLGMDISYFGMALLVLIVYGILLIFRRKKTRKIETNLKKWSLAFSSILAGFLLLCLVHFLLGTGFRSVKNINIAMMPAMIHTGLVNKYLNNNCHERDLNLCAYQDSIDSILTGTGKIKPSFQKPANVKEFQTIANEIQLQNNITRKMIANKPGDLSGLLTNMKIPQYKSISDSSKTMQAINGRFDEVRECILARQFRDQLSFKYLSLMQIIVTILLLTVSIFIFFYRIAARYRSVFTLILLAIFINALVNTLLYGDQSNALTQIIWVMPVPLFLYLSDKN